MKSFVPEIKQFQSGSVIFNEGDPGKVAYLIQEGSVNIVKRIKDKKNVLATLSVGEIFGEMAVISSSKRTAGAEAVTDCSLTVLDAKLIYALLKKSHPIVFHLTKVLIARLADANSGIGVKRSENVWMTMCKFLDLKCRIARRDPVKSMNVGIEYNNFCFDLKQIANISKNEIDRMLESAISVKLITRTKILSEYRLDINDPETFLDSAASLSEEFNTLSGVVCRTEFLDIYDFAKAVNSTPEIIYKKIGLQEFPDDICLLHKKGSQEWAKRVGLEFFREGIPQRVSLKEVEGLDDILFVDATTLEKIFHDLGYYKMGILLTVAEGNVYDKIVSVLSDKIVNAILEDSKGRTAIDFEEAVEIEEDLVNAINRLMISDKN
ncbi:Crp/Fnr family transcriptional regulator [Maridesulfovibrio bastinii]|uniref:Crp/Fnr family transcriptional regulator n=1 Tax=Maridesulfovibrio bastinii TaxID=47157 RepID=UPI00040A68DB|nr:cyclic nucleotide-binding domain-containing protein [Maridesulfovibrio bastinii]